MAGYDCNIQYLTCKDNVQADILSRAVDESTNNDDPPVDIDDKNCIISSINSYHFEPKEFAWCKNTEDPAMTHIRPSLQGDRYNPNRIMSVVIFFFSFLHLFLNSSIITLVGL